MIDKAIIIENYSKMEDGQLIKIAREDGHTLTPEAFQILKDEFKKRNLDYSHINDAEETKTLIHQEKIQEIKDDIQKDNLDAVWKYALEEKIHGTARNEIVARLVERGLDEPRAIELLNNLPIKIKDIIKAKDTKMLLGGIFFVAGILLRLLGNNTTDKGRILIGSWVLIIFALVRFFTGMEEKKKYKKYLEIVGDNVNGDGTQNDSVQYRGH